VIACIGAAVDHLMNERKRQISGQLLVQRPVTFTRERVILMGAHRFDVRLEEDEADLVVRFAGEDGHVHRLQSQWTAGEKVWRGTMDGEPIAVQVRPILNGFNLAHRGVRLDVFIYTARGGRTRRLDAGGAADRHIEALLCRCRASSR